MVVCDLHGTSIFKGMFLERPVLRHNMYAFRSRGLDRNTSTVRTYVYVRLNLSEFSYRTSVSVLLGLKYCWVKPSTQPLPPHNIHHPHLCPYSTISDDNPSSPFSFSFPLPSGIFS